ncbi:hypothetical protein SDC9_202725 [bioreactor metagenome]|uniref:Uncharacterized protein n=1 Tax=bioreactor metagenome TaxID=1076179 RepID=A0A645IV43_9ZZZZ
MDDAGGLRANLPVGVDMRHHIVPHFGFAFGNHVIVNIVRVCG